VTKRRRDLILDKFSDILDTNFVLEMEKKHEAKAKRRQERIAKGLNASDSLNEDIILD